MRLKIPTKAIILDWGGVIVEEFLVLLQKKVYQYIIKKYNSKITHDKLSSVMKQYDKDYLTGKLNGKEFLEKNIFDLNLKCTENDICELKIFLESVYARKKVIEELEKLKYDYNLVLFSNNYKEIVQSHVQKDLINIFDKMYLSCEYGLHKSELFNQMIDDLVKDGYDVEEMIFIDDKEKYIALAKNLGMKTLLANEASFEEKFMILLNELMHQYEEEKYNFCHV